MKQNKYLAFCDPYEIHETEVKDMEIIKYADTMSKLLEEIEDWYYSNFNEQVKPARIGETICVGNYKFFTYKITKEK